MHLYLVFNKSSHRVSVINWYNFICQHCFWFKTAFQAGDPVIRPVGYPANETEYPTNETGYPANETGYRI